MDDVVANARACVRQIGDIARNKHGTSQAFRIAANELEKIIEGISVDEHVRELIRTMKRFFAGKTAGTWKPFAALLLRALHEGEDAIKQDRLRWKVTESEMEVAERAARANAAPVARAISVVPKVMAKKKVSAAEGSQASASAIASCSGSGAASSSMPKAGKKTKKCAEKDGEDAAAKKPSMGSGIDGSSSGEGGSISTSGSSGSCSSSATTPLIVVQPTSASPVELAASTPLVSSPVQRQAMAGWRAAGKQQVSLLDMWHRGSQVVATASAEERGGTGAAAGFKRASESSSGETAPPPKRRSPSKLGDVTCETRKHLQVLGLKVGASVAEVRSAYRRAAKTMHPDKGGSSEKFHLVEEAFCALLRDPAQRAAGGGGEVSLEHAPAERDVERPPDATTVKIAGLSLLNLPEKLWPSFLAGLSTAVVELLSELMTKGPASGASLDAPEDTEDPDEDEEDVAATAEEEEARSSHRARATRKCKPGIFKVGGGLWAVKIGWRCFVVRSDPLSEDRAWDLYFSLLEVREGALCRHSENLAAMSYIGRACKPSEWDHDCPPLLDSELRQLLLPDPLVDLYFSSDLRRRVNGSSERVMSLFTPVLSSSFVFRSLIRKTLGAMHEPLGRKDQIANCREVIQERVDRERSEHQQSREKMALVVASEVARRKALEAALPAPPAAVPAAPAMLAEGPMTLALADLRESAEADRMQMVAVQAELGEVRQDLKEAKDSSERQQGEFQEQMQSCFAGLAAQQQEQQSRLSKLVAVLMAREREGQHAKDNEELRNEVLVMQQDKEKLAKTIEFLRHQVASRNGPGLQRNSSMDSQLAHTMASIQADAKNATLRERANANPSSGRSNSPRSDAWRAAKAGANMASRA
mmetsp:Transcript_11350/g.40251  ORF Transcript_11350/g.40251 Transcript_11350/m.40251 type:complete len:872 (+) Transcript_11350:61-2676(+)